MLMEMASELAAMIPHKVILDSLGAYLDGIELVFGSFTTHVQSSPFAKEDSTNRIERMQGTIRERTKVVRGYKSLDTARIIVGGFMLNYNYFRPHMSLKDFPPKGVDKTPADVAKVIRPVKNWTELVRKVGLK